MQESIIESEVARIKAGLDKIANAVGKAKIDAINDVWGDSEVQWALRVLLDPSIVFHVKEKSLHKEVPLVAHSPYISMKEMLEELSSKRALKDDDIARIQKTLIRIGDSALLEYARNFLCKSITLGVTAKTVNKAVGKNVIPVMEVMLAKRYFDHPHELGDCSFTITEKLDGIRCIAIVEQGKKPILLSRQGQLIEGLTQVELALEEMRCSVLHDFVFDGELLISERSGYPSKEQYKRTIKIVRREGVKSGITYHVFDMMSVRSFLWHTPTQSYLLRRDSLEEMFSDFDSPWLKTLPVIYNGKDQSMVQKCLEEQRSLGHEGIMINLDGAPYIFGRTSCLLKAKVMSDCDLEIIGVQEGKGKFEGSLGALVVNYKGNPVGVGSGLTDELRSEIWAHPDDYIGKIATIQYFEETNDADGKLSMRFPVFKDLCEPGKEPSYY